MLKCNETGTDMWKSETRCTGTSGKQKSRIHFKILRREWLAKTLQGIFFPVLESHSIFKHLDQMVFFFFTYVNQHQLYTIQVYVVNLPVWDV